MEQSRSIAIAARGFILIVVYSLQVLLLILCRHTSFVCYEGRAPHGEGVHDLAPCFTSGERKWELRSIPVGLMPPVVGSLQDLETRTKISLPPPATRLAYPQTPLPSLPSASSSPASTIPGTFHLIVPLSFKVGACILVHGIQRSG